MRTTNQECREYVQECKSFKANNLEGMRGEKAYVVVSYGWYILFVYDFATGIWYENIDRYSVSTSRQKSQAHPLADTVKLTWDEIQKIKT